MSTGFRVLPLAFPGVDNESIDINEVRNICSRGLSECPPEDRLIAWLILSGLFPQKGDEWTHIRNCMKNTYTDYCSHFGVNEWINRTILDNQREKDQSLSDSKMMSQIHNDLMRSGRHLCFLPCDEAPDPSMDFLVAPYWRHIRRIERILYVFGNCNIGFGYLQGFNELIIPLYYVVISSSEFLGNDMEEVESVTFHLFQQLMTATDLNSLYTTQDHSSVIIHRLHSFETLLKSEIPEVADAIHTLGMHPLMYCYRWFNLLFAQEHELPSLLILWDGLFSHYDTLLDFTFYVGIAHVRTIKNQIKSDDFSSSVYALQNMSSGNIFSILKDANVMWEISKTNSRSHKRAWIGFIKKIVNV